MKEYYEFCNQDYQEVIKYISTRWLCTERCINRALKKYTSLQSYFLSESERDKRFLRLSEAFLNNMTEFYVMFFQAVLPTFTNFNKFLQTEELLIQCLYDEMQTFMNKFASKFVKPKVIHKLKDDNLSLSKLDISLPNQKDDRDLTIGNITKPNLRRSLNEGDISHGDVHRFYDAVQEFYETAYTYCVKWLPLDDELYKDSRFIEFSKRAEFSFNNITELLSLCLRKFKDFIQDPHKLDAPEEEYLMYQSVSNTEIPEDMWEQSLVKDTEEHKYYHMDMNCGYLRASLPRLVDIALFLLTIPHSNATEERIFSTIRKK